MFKDNYGGIACPGNNTEFSSMWLSVFITIDSPSWSHIPSGHAEIDLQWYMWTSFPLGRHNIVSLKVVLLLPPNGPTIFGTFFFLGIIEGLWWIHWEVVIARVWPMVSLSSFLTSRTVAVIICKHGGHPWVTVSNLWIDRPQVSPVFEPILLCHPLIVVYKQLKD